MNKVYLDVKVVLEGLIFNGMIVMVGGFGFCGILENLIVVLCDFGVIDIMVVFNNVGVDDFGLGFLL